MWLFCRMYDQGILLQVVAKTWPSYAISSKLLDGDSSTNYFAVKQGTCLSWFIPQARNYLRRMRTSFSPT